MKTDINGKLINDFDEYRLFVANKHSEEWLKSNVAKFYKAFGKPFRYPFIFIELPNDYEDSAYCPTALVKVYF